MRFIPFKDTPEQSEEETQSSGNELLGLGISISIESGRLLESASINDAENIKNLIPELQEKLELLLSKVSNQKIDAEPTEQPTVYSGVTLLNNIINNERALDNGGMAPPKEWKSITELHLKSSEKYDLIEEMRKLKSQGQTVIKSNYHHRTPVSIEEFTEPFKYMENMHDYNGSFLITLLKSDVEISNQAATFQVDLRAEKDACSNGDGIILSVYDITGSPSNGEEKKFLLVLSFDKLYGTLKFSHPIFMNGKKCTLSHRQLSEIEKFCKAKKINS